MSFYTVIETELKDKEQVICALAELEKRGEITSYKIKEKKGEISIEVDRDGDILNVTREKNGHFIVGGDNRYAETFSKRLAQIYAYVTIMENLPLDFELVKETEQSGEIKILLKG